MDTPPGRTQATEPGSLCDKRMVVELETLCPRQRFFVEARKRDDGDAVRIAEEC